MSIDGLKIEAIEKDYAVVLDDSDNHEIVLPCEDEEDAWAMRHMFGGDVIARNIYIGAFVALSPEGKLSETG